MGTAARTSLTQYAWQRGPRLAARIATGQSDAAHALLDDLLDEYDREHTPALGPRKLRCAALMSHCLRGAHRAGSPSPIILDEFMCGIDDLQRKRSWGAVRRFMHAYVDSLLAHVITPRASRVDRLIDRIRRDLHHGEGLSRTLETYAREADLDLGYLSRRFKARVGQNYLDERRHARMNRAARLLTVTTAKISAIARRVGIDDPSRFARQFREHLGMTPHQFRMARRRDGAADRPVTPPAGKRNAPASSTPADRRRRPAPTR